MLRFRLFVHRSVCVIDWMYIDIFLHCSEAVGSMKKIHYLLNKCIHLFIKDALY